MKINIDGRIYKGSARDIVTTLRENSFSEAKTNDEFITKVTERLPTLAQSLVSVTSLLRAEEFLAALVVAKLAERVND